MEPLEFVITNTGNSPITNMAISWDEATGVILPVYSSNTKYISYLDVGESATVTYSVMADVNAEPGLYQLDITLEFEDYESNLSTIATKAGLFVGGTTDFDLSYSESDEGEVSLSLANVGNNEAYSVKVSIPEQDNFQATGSTSTIVGNLEKGDYTITSFSISQTSSMPSMSDDSSGTAQAEPSEMTEDDMEAMQEEMESKSELLVNIEYTDSAGQRQVVEKAVQIEELTGGTMAEGMSGGPGGQSSSSNSYLLYGAVILVVAVLGLNYRKKKMLKEGNYVPLNVEIKNLKAKILKKEKQ
ncbi:MAG: COG1361 S-layer family protein [Methanolobus sp.]